MYKIIFNKKDNLMIYGEYWFTIMNCSDMNYITYDELGRKRYIIFSSDIIKFKKTYFDSYKWISTQENIQDIYDNYLDNKFSCNFYQYFELGVDNVNEEYLFYLKLKNPEIFNDLEVIKNV